MTSVVSLVEMYVWPRLYAITNSEWKWFLLLFQQVRLLLRVDVIVPVKLLNSEKDKIKF